jgi:hypothetical protein
MCPGQGGTRHAKGARAAQRTEVGGMDGRFSAERDEVAGMSGRAERSTRRKRMPEGGAA